MAVSDSGWLVRARLLRENGRLTGIETAPIRRLKGTNGKPLTRRHEDSEGLALAPDGAFFVSFERVHRVLRYDPAKDAATALPQPGAFQRLRDNKSLEALAIDRHGALHTLPERSPEADGRFPVYRFAGGKWRKAFDLPKRGPFLAVGADFGPEGRFYLLERDFTGFGFATRVRRFTLEGGRIAGEETLLQTRSRRHDNLEGISVWRDAAGAIRMTMVSDDNYRFYQTTEIVEYRVAK